MSKYLLAYHGGSGMPETEEEGAAIMAAWNEWYGSMGEAVVDGGAPTGRAKTVSADGDVSEGGGAGALSGYTVIAADSIDDAVAHAKNCPIRDAGGSIQVAELIEM